MKNKTYLRTFLLISVLLTDVICNAQSLKEYFLPASGINTLVYGVPTMPDMKEEVYFKESGDSEILGIRHYTEKGLQDWTEALIKIDDSKIWVAEQRSSSSKYVDSLGEGELVLLKMPKRGSKITWTDATRSGAVATIHIAEFAWVKIQSSKKRAIKVTSTTYKRHSRKRLACKVDYFVAGMGRYKTTTDEDFLSQQLERQENNQSLKTLD